MEPNAQSTTQQTVTPDVDKVDRKANLAVLHPMQMNAGIMPTTLSEAMELAKIFSQSGLVPKALQNKPADTLVVMLKGLELGLKPMQALSGIDVIEGKAGSNAKLKVGMVISNPLCEYFRLIESSPTKATFVTKRRGDEQVTMTYTIEQAQLAQLLGKDNWRKHPASMLRARASSALCDAVYADIVQGLMTRDELDEVRERVVGSGQSSGAAGFGGTVAPPPPPSPPSPASTAPPPIAEEPEEDEDFDWSAQPLAKVEEKPAEPVVTEKQPVSNEPSPLEKMLALISEATEGRHLEALVDSIKKLPKSDQLLIKKAYGEKREALAAAAAGKPGAA